MAWTIDSQTTADSYSDACTISRIFPSAGGYATISGNDVYAELEYGRQGASQWGTELHIPAGTATIPGAASDGTPCTGIRFRSYQAGLSATVTASFFAHAEPGIAIGSGGQSSPSDINVITAYNVKAAPYLAKGDGTTDDTASIQAAINACGLAGGGIVFFPQGVYKITSTLTMNNPYVTLMGAGDGFNLAAGAEGGASEIRWGGGFTANFMLTSTPTTSNGIKSCHIERLLWNCNRKSSGVQLTGWQEGSLTDLGIILTQRNGNSAGTHDGIALNCVGNPTALYTFCHHQHLTLDGATCLQLDGGTPIGNDVTESTWDHINCTYGSSTGNANGANFNACDANTFTRLYFFVNFGTGYDLYLGPSARCNYFYYMHPTINGIYIDAPAVPASFWHSIIYGYNRGDGGVAPVGPGVANLSIDDTSSGPQYGAFFSRRVVDAAVQVSVSMTGGSVGSSPNIRNGSLQQYTLTGNPGAPVTFTFNNASGVADVGVPPAFSHEVTFELLNSLSSGSLAAVAVGGNYNLVGATLAAPAGGKRRWYKFHLMTAAGALVFIDQAPADY